MNIMMSIVIMATGRNAQNGKVSVEWLQGYLYVFKFMLVNC